MVAAPTEFGRLRGAGITRQLPNLEANPRVSIAVCSTPYTDWTDWHQVRGAQITATPMKRRGIPRSSGSSPGTSSSATLASCARATP